ncbi:MAG: hypothetical protein LC108_02920 [Anaerolineales bacterium]|nr:hypothetical protein [Anaerolineales bacterium]
MIEKGSEPSKSPSFAGATQALYSLCYTLKFMLKKRKTNAFDYPIMPLEGLWGVTDETFDITIKDNWSYTLMIMQPDVVTKDSFEEARENVRKKKGDGEMLNQLIDLRTGVRTFEEASKESRLSLQTQTHSQRGFHGKVYHFRIYADSIR